jgi:dihydrofolate reductase
VANLPLVIVAAVARNGVIGDGEKLLWRLPSDLKHFKALTLGKPMIMGRKTFVSIGKPLPGRQTIVVTRDRTFAAEGVQVAHSVDEALALGQAAGADMNANELILAGGGELYADMIGYADVLHITEVDCAPVGNAVFPKIDLLVWLETSREAHLPGLNDDAGFSFVTYERRDRRRPRS